VKALPEKSSGRAPSKRLRPACSNMDKGAAGTARVSKVRVAMKKFVSAASLPAKCAGREIPAETPVPVKGLGAIGDE